MRAVAINDASSLHSTQHKKLRSGGPPEDDATSTPVLARTDVLRPWRVVRTRRERLRSTPTTTKFGPRANVTAHLSLTMFGRTRPGPLRRGSSIWRRRFWTGFHSIGSFNDRMGITQQQMT